MNTVPILRPPAFLTLPQELVELIDRYLSLESIMTLRLVNSYFRYKYPPVIRALLLSALSQSVDNIQKRQELLDGFHLVRSSIEMEDKSLSLQTIMTLDTILVGVSPNDKFINVEFLKFTLEMGFFEVARSIVNNNDNMKKAKRQLLPQLFREEGGQTLIIEWLEGDNALLEKNLTDSSGCNKTSRPMSVFHWALHFGCHKVAAYLTAKRSFEKNPVEEFDILLLIALSYTELDSEKVDTWHQLLTTFKGKLTDKKRKEMLCNWEQGKNDHIFSATQVVFRVIYIPYLEEIITSRYTKARFDNDNQSIINDAWHSNSQSLLQIFVESAISELKNNSLLTKLTGNMISDNLIKLKDKISGDAQKELLRVNVHFALAVGGGQIKRIELLTSQYPVLIQTDRVFKFVMSSCLSQKHKQKGLRIFFSYFLKTASHKEWEKYLLMLADKNCFDSIQYLLQELDIDTKEILRSVILEHANQLIKRQHFAMASVLVQHFELSTELSIETCVADAMQKFDERNFSSNAHMLAFIRQVVQASDSVDVHLLQWNNFYLYLFEHILKIDFDAYEKREIRHTVSSTLEKLLKQKLLTPSVAMLDALEDSCFDYLPIRLMLLNEHLDKAVFDRYWRLIVEKMIWIVQHKLKSMGNTLYPLIKRVFYVNGYPNLTKYIDINSQDLKNIVSEILKKGYELAEEEQATVLSDSDSDVIAQDDDSDATVENKKQIKANMAILLDRDNNQRWPVRFGVHTFDLSEADLVILRALKCNLVSSIGSQALEKSIESNANRMSALRFFAKKDDKASVSDCFSALPNLLSYKTLKGS